LRGRMNKEFRGQDARRQAGFTLVEVMVGIVLTAILALGLTALWAFVGDEFLRLGLRQKAVFALNSEMERLAMVYKLDAPTTETVTVNGNPRLIYKSDYNFGAIIDANSDFQIGEVFYHNGGAGVADDKNLIWLDKGKNIVAAVSWVVSDPATIPAIRATECFGGACFLLVLYIDFPYRFDAATQNLQPMAPVNNISLQTIIGKK